MDEQGKVVLGRLQLNIYEITLIPMMRKVNILLFDNGDFYHSII